MILRRILKRFISQDWIILLSELTIVVAGIFIAFQVDRWWANRISNLQTQQYKLRLVEDIEQDLINISYAAELAGFRLQLAELLMDVARTPENPGDRGVEFLVAINQAAFTYTAALTSDTFEELQATGKLSLLQDADLKGALFDYYRYDETQRQFLRLQLMTEFKHFELSAGTLTNDQFSFVQDNIRIATPLRPDRIQQLEYDPQKILEAVRRFRANSELIAWLPQLRGMQLELIEVHLERKKRAEALLDILNKW